MPLVKSLGMMIIVLSCTALGFSGASVMRARVRTLSALISSLELMKSEIYTRLTPMPELMELLGRESKYPVSQLYERVGEGMRDGLGVSSFAEIWTQAVEKSDSLGLSFDEMTALSDLAKSLGRFDASEQASAIEACIARLEGFRLEAELCYKSKGRVWQSVGIAGGLLLAIVLL